MSSEKIYFSSQNYYDEVFSSIRQAKSSVDVNVYILENDSIGKKLAQALDEACRKGVSCRLLLDGFGSKRWIDSKAYQWLEETCEVRLFNPLPKFWITFLGHLTLKGLKFISKLNRRDHKKLINIDGKKSFVGSINFSQVSLQQREVAVSSDYAIDQCQQYFEYTWLRSKSIEEDFFIPFKKKLPKDNLKPDKYIRCNHNFVARQKSIQEIYSFIDSAKEKSLHGYSIFSPISETY